MKSNVVIFVLVILLAFFATEQIKAVGEISEVTNESNVLRLAYEVVDIYSTSVELQQDANSLELKNENFSFDLKDRTRLKQELEQKIADYRLINGLEEISGRGIEITVSGEILTEEMVDLINGIRNARPQAIGINNNRVIYRSSFIVDSDKLVFDDKRFSIPFSIQVIGDPGSLRKSLDRSGGILDILKKNAFDKISFSIDDKDSIIIPAYGADINFHFSKITN